jgi:WD40 repeat protein
MRIAYSSLIVVFSFVSVVVVLPAVAADKPAVPREEGKLTDLPGEVTKITFASDGKSLIAQTYFQPPHKPGYGIGGGGPGFPIVNYVAWTFTPRKVTKLNPIVFQQGGCLPSPNQHSLATWNPIGPDALMQDFHDVDAEIKGEKPKFGKGRDIKFVMAPVVIPKADRPRAWKWLENTMEPMAFSPNGEVAAAKLAKERAVVLFDVAKDKRNGKIELGGSSLDNVPGVVFSGDSKMVAVPRCDGSPVRVCATDSGKERSRVGKFYLGSVLSLDADGKTLALGNPKSANVQLWDTATGKLRSTWRTGLRGVYDLAYSGDGKVLFAAGDKIILVWDSAAGREIARLRGHTAAVTVLVVSADGKHLASGGKDKAVRLWDVSAYAPPSRSRDESQSEQRP